ncbi:MAG: hypothetical protein GY807_18500 [Gammaproteobacteria bacterium]|nr:hypothetical protein [Gammaproteobacteria bacterium]
MKLKVVVCAMTFGFVLTSCSGGPYALNEEEALKAEAGARDFAERSGGKYISCSGQDSEKDGYVTCSVDADAGPKDIACAYKSRGCKSKN